MPDPPLILDNPFWRFSSAVYAAPEVRLACLAMQDRFGLDVNIALLCAWLGAERGVAAGPEAIAEAEALVAPWRHAAVSPLRAARRAIRTLHLLAEPEVAALRQRIATLELEAEKVQQAMLFRWVAARVWRGPGAAQGNLDAWLRDRGVAGDTAAQARIVARAAVQCAGQA